MKFTQKENHSQRGKKQRGCKLKLRCADLQKLQTSFKQNKLTENVIKTKSLFLRGIQEI